MRSDPRPEGAFGPTLCPIGLPAKYPADSVAAFRTLAEAPVCTQGGAAKSPMTMLPLRNDRLGFGDSNGRAISVVIPTFNRGLLIERAIHSVLCQNSPSMEIVVVDDASTDNTSQIVRDRFPQVRFFRHDHNQGPGPARERGIREARGRWVFMLDDDDELVPDALQAAADAISEFPAAAQYPAVQFACSNGALAVPFRVLSLNDYLRGQVRGDFLPIVQREVFLNADVHYPTTRLGGEHLLWWALAERFGLPTWNRALVRVHGDAPDRLTSVQQQVNRAEEHAALQEMTIARFGPMLKLQMPAILRKKHLGAASYWLLASQRRRAWPHLQAAFALGSRGPALALGIMALAPNSVVRRSYSVFRRLTTRHFRQPDSKPASAA